MQPACVGLQTTAKERMRYLEKPELLEDGAGGQLQKPRTNADKKTLHADRQRDLEGRQ